MCKRPESTMLAQVQCLSLRFVSAIKNSPILKMILAQVLSSLRRCPLSMNQPFLGKVKADLVQVLDGVFVILGDLKLSFEQTTVTFFCLLMFIRLCRLYLRPIKNSNTFRWKIRAHDNIGRGLLYCL